MKKILFTTVLVAMFLCGYSQENLMGKTDAQIKEQMGYLKAKFSGYDYSSSGDKCAKFSFPMSNERGFLDAVFFYDDNGICNSCKYYYPTSKELNGLVTAIKVGDDYEKVPDAFAWINHKGKYSLEIIRIDNSTGFYLAYNHLK